MAFIGHRFRGGAWQIPRRYRAVAWMAGVEIDLSEAIFPPDGAELDLVAVMGVITVDVPSDVDVVVFGDAIAWTTGDESGNALTAVAVRRHLRIRSRAVLGKVYLRRIRPRLEPIEST